jgi:hypothetical protein
VSARAARALEHQLGRALSQKKQVTSYGRITGPKTSKASCGSPPKDGVLEFRARIDDEQLRRRAVEYQIDQPRVHATFDVYESLPPGDDTIVRSSRTLANLRLTPAAEQNTLDTTR